MHRGASTMLRNGELYPQYRQHRLCDGHVLRHMGYEAEENRSRLPETIAMLTESRRSIGLKT